MFMPRVNSKQKRVKRTQNAKQKSWNWGNSPPKLSSSPWWAEYSLCHHVARHGEWSCSPWRAKHASCDTMLAVASSFARRGGQTWLSVTILLASRVSLLAVASTDSWLSRKAHSSSQNPNFEPRHPKFDFQSLPKHFQTLKELQNHMKFEPKHFSNQKPHLTHFCKPH